MKKFLYLALVFLSMMQLYIQQEEEEQGTIRKKRKYTVDLQHLCPQVPSKTAEKCTRSFNITKYFQKLYTNDEAKKLDGNPNELPEKWLDLAECQIDKLETPSISLEVHCYFEGVKEGLVEFNKEFALTPQGIQRMFTKIDNRIQNAKNKYVREMLEDVKVELTEALGTIENQGLVVDAKPEPSS